MQWMATTIAQWGVAAACLGYRTVESGAGLEDMLSDLRVGIDAALDRYQPDCDSRILLVGHSAGGYLALRMLPERCHVDIVALAPITLFDQHVYLELGNRAAIALWANSSAPGKASVDEVLSLRTLMDRHQDTGLQIKPFR
jgi:alpha-beta hydrolase superfamily lysophospholipase